MSLLDPLFPRRASVDEIERVSRQLPRAAAAPDPKSLRRVCESHDPIAAADWMHWSVWQDRRSNQVWIHCTGGVAGIDAWFGPGDPRVAAGLGAEQPDDGGDRAAG